MKKITLEEKIKLITAYAEGKPVEAYDTIFRRWFEKGTDTWDFDREEYRIKPNEAAKFEVGDVLVLRSDVDTPDVTTYEIREVNQYYYRFSDKSLHPIEEVEKKFINIKDVLWYFEVFDFISKEPHIYPTRITMSDINKKLAPYHDTLSWKPIYALGFKLKEN
ncbi:hypothetical protein [Campylobacter concisus]|uniref:hypothetical protein n=1 Tax=Campylobacter concisus TaxID=199 RepID=UPI000AE67FB2|nr:hypothetical protein [Campylobacter concisus]